MNRPGQVPDRQILQKVQQRLSRLGLGSSKVNTQVRRGDVTLSGNLQFENQRRTVLQAARGVEGARRIVDQLQIAPAARKWQQEPRPSLS